MDQNIKARLAFDGATLTIPSEMGVPRSDQMQGTLFERFSEMCTRVCYDSMSTGRTSPKMHEHLLDVAHWSVYEHAHWTVKFSQSTWGNAFTFLALLNRPELRVVVKDDELRITLNLRHLLDWDRWTRLSYNGGASQDSLFDEILHTSRDLAPLVFQRLTQYSAPVGQATVVEPKYNCEKFITVFLSGGRGMSHEQVRHRFNMSQRSTRYVDESGSPIIEHPLISKYMDENPTAELRDARKKTHEICGDTYDNLVVILQDWLISKGVDKFTARKQARGAARNDLGNGLLTELFFTANIDMWDAMIALRANVAADAEIRHMYTADTGVLTALMASRYGDHFKNKWRLEPSPDGLGKVATENK